MGRPGVLNPSFALDYPGRNGGQMKMGHPSWTAIISQDEGWWIGWIAEVPGVNAQERTREELLETLSEVLREALEMNRQDARAHADDRYEEVAAAL